MDISRFVDHIARERHCSRELATALMTDCLAVLHEASYKRGTGASLQAVHAELGPLATWHFVGLVVDAAEKADPGALVRDYMRLEPSSVEYDAIAEQWDREMRPAGGS